MHVKKLIMPHVSLVFESLITIFTFQLVFFFFYFNTSGCRCVFRIRIRIQQLKQIRIHADPDRRPIKTVNKFSKGGVLWDTYFWSVSTGLYRHEFGSGAWQVYGGRCFITCDLQYVSMFTLCVKIEVQMTGQMTFAFLFGSLRTTIGFSKCTIRNSIASL